jgi:hypothetical protein
MSAIGLKSPCFPLFQRGILACVFLTPLWKRGEGEIFARNYLINFGYRTLGPARNILEDLVLPVFLRLVGISVAAGRICRRPGSVSLDLSLHPSSQNSGR